MKISGAEIFVIGTVAVVGIIGYLVRRFSSPPFLVQRWAKDNGFRILHSEFRYFFKGPFTRTISHRGREVYHVRVRDSEGRERSCWLRCTEVGIFTGDKTEVMWETEA